MTEFKTKRRNATAVALRALVETPRTFREMTAGEDPAPSTFRPFDRKKWRRAQRENLRPLDLSVFATPGGFAALQMIHCWASVTEVRRATGDISACPALLDGSIPKDGGFSLPDVLLKAADVERYLQREAPWKERLLTFVFIDGWTTVCREIVYLLPSQTLDREIRAWEALIEDFERPEPLDDDARAVIEWAKVEIRNLHERQLIVLDEREPAPVQATQKLSLLVRRWTFDLAKFYRVDIEDLEPWQRRNLLELQLSAMVRDIASALWLGPTDMPRLSKMKRPVVNRDLGDEA